jgi:hypothetical protein
MLVLDTIEILPPLGKYKYDTWRILPMKCYIENSVHLRSCIRNVNSLLAYALRLSGPTHGRPLCSSRLSPGDVVPMVPNLISSPRVLGKRALILVN